MSRLDDQFDALGYAVAAMNVMRVPKADDMLRSVCDLGADDELKRVCGLDESDTETMLPPPERERSRGDV
jgi:hypothetical protein